MSKVVIEYSFDSDVPVFNVENGETAWKKLVEILTEEIGVVMYEDSDDGYVEVDYDAVNETATLIYPNGDKAYYKTIKE